MKRTPKETLQHRISKKTIVRLGDFAPWWVGCKQCQERALLVAEAGKLMARCSCTACGALYSIELSQDYPRRMLELPLWFRSDFRGEVFWAVNGDHLLFLEEIIGARLRERPIHRGSRIKLTRAMPFNLPSWMLSAKNRPDILRLIRKLKKRLPKDFVPSKPKQILTETLEKD